MKRFLRVLFIFFLSIAILIASLTGAAYLQRETILKLILKKVMDSVLGFETESGGVGFIPPSTFHVKDFTVYNPSGFRHSVFAKAPHAEVILDILPAIQRKKYHLSKLKILVSEIHFEKNKNGVSNITLLKPVKKNRKPDDPSAPPGPRKFFLDKLVLSIHTVTYEDDSGVIPTRVTHDIQVENQVYENVRNLDAVVNLILLRILYGKTFGNLGLNNERIRDMVLSTVSSSGDFFKQTGALIKEKTGSFVNQTRELVVTSPVIEATRGTLETATERTKEQLSGIVEKIKSTVGGTPEPEPEPAPETLPTPVPSAHPEPVSNGKTSGLSS